ncbi:MAG: hypothetical protein ABIF19_01265 [Planctomycetota bacterium]
MNDQNGENLDELLEKFFDGEQAENYIEDVQKVEQILREHPAPEPDDMLIANIKAEIAMRLPVRRARLFRRRLYEVAVVAATIVVVAAVSVRFFDEPSSGPGQRVYAASLIPKAIWESHDIAADDENLAVFTAEIKQIENEVLALESDEDSSESDTAITELEMELIETSSDFWKG